MSIFSTINGVHRSMDDQYAKVNGVYRRQSVSVVKVNGVFRTVTLADAKPENVVSFRMIYSKNRLFQYQPHPDYSFNPKIPYHFNTTGATANEMDDTLKGVIFEFTNDNPYETGNVFYTGVLYAYLDNGTVVNVASDSILSELDITMDAYLHYNVYGYFMEGHNSIFSEDFLPEMAYPNQGWYTNRIDLNDLSITHAVKQLAEIGISRSADGDHTKNMIGCKGILDQSIRHIKVNGVPRPFSIGIYHG